MSLNYLRDVARKYGIRIWRTPRGWFHVEDGERVFIRQRLETAAMLVYGLIADLPDLDRAGQ